MTKNDALHQLGPGSQTPARRLASVVTGAKRGIQRLLNRLGYQILPFPAPHSYEHHILALFATLAVNCVIDVGAHEGEFYQLLRQTGYDGHIASFEPVPESFAQLRRAAEGDPHWRGYNVALGREAGTLPINVPDSTGFTSFLQPNAYCEERFPHAHWDGRTVVARIERLQSIYPDAIAGLERPRVFLKMDTQGWDAHVLEGAGEMLADVIALQSEVSVIPIYHGMRSMVESIAHYNALGFELTHLFPVTFDADDIRVLEYDCVMCRTTPRINDAAQLVGFGTIDHDTPFAALFPTRGQPTDAPARLALATVLQFAEGRLNRQAADAVRSRIDWQQVLGLELTDPGFQHTVLSAFRTRLVAGEAASLRLDALLTLAQAQGLLNVHGCQRTDAIPVLAAIRVLNRLERVGETLRAALNTLAVVAPAW